jgi:hypothetical protein
VNGLPKLYDMRVQYSDEPHTDWYGPYALTDEDVKQITLSDHDKRAGNAIRTVEIREHECDDPINGGCGHMREGLPAPY